MMAEANLTYSFSYSSLRAAVDAEVSKVAQRAVGPEGQSLYDALKIYSNDKNQVDAAIRDALDSVMLRFVDMGTLEDTGTSYIMKFYAPDFNPDDSGVLEREILRYITGRAVADWLSTKYPDTAKFFAETVADKALARITVALRTRVKPTRV